MERFKIATILACFLCAHCLSAQTVSKSVQFDSSPASTTLGPLRTNGLKSHQGTSTVLGGEITRIDPVRDKLQIKVYGRGVMTILFDPNTQIFLDGKPAPIDSLALAQHASVQTVLAKGAVYAVSIHILAEATVGGCDGNVLSYDPETHILVVNGTLAGSPVRMLVTEHTTLITHDQDASAPRTKSPSSSDLRKGTQLSVLFKPDRNGTHIAEQITIVASAGSSLALSGPLSFLDIHSGMLQMHDEDSNTNYDVHFDTLRFPLVKEIHLGDPLTVSVTFDGSRYVADAIARE